MLLTLYSGITLPDSGTYGMLVIVARLAACKETPYPLYYHFSTKHS